jgi:DNA-binding transcriptional ArsR family regulator
VKPVDADPLDRAFAALADPTRRGILGELGAADSSIGDIAERYAMTLTGAAKHVRVLEEAGLVATFKVGRVRTVTVGPHRLDEAARWIDDYRRAVDARFDRLDALLGRLREQG